MTRDRAWAGAFSALARAGVAVRTYAYSAPLYIHAKAIVVDPARAVPPVTDLLRRRKKSAESP